MVADQIEPVRSSFPENYTTTALPEIMANISPQLPPLVRGRGLTIWDAAGNEYLDLCGQTLNMALGHAHPQVLADLRDQLGRIWFTSSKFGSEPFLELCRRLVTLTPDGLDTVNLKQCDAADAVETAMKLSRLHTRREAILCVRGGWHGETIATVGMNHQHRYPLVGEAGPIRYSEDNTLESLAVAAYSNPDVAAVIVDPIGVSNGLFRPETIRAGLRSLRAACDHTGSLLIFDESQTYGYLGEGLFATCLYGVTPDLLCLGKALGAGLPLAATMCSRELRSLILYGEAEFTHGGQVLPARAGLSGLEFLVANQQTITDNMRAFQDAMGEVARQCPFLDLRISGFFAAFRPPEQVAPDWIECAVRRGLERGLLLRNNHSIAVLVKPAVIIDGATSTAVGRRLSALFRDVEDEMSTGSVTAAPVAIATSGLDLAHRQPAWAESLRALVPTASIRRREPAEVAALAGALKSIGVKCQVTSSSDQLKRASLATFLRQIDDDAEGREVANTIILHHQRWIEMAHDHGLVLGDRTAHTAAFIRSGVVLCELSWALEGDGELAAFEEALAIAHLTSLIAAPSVRDDLQRRLVPAYLRRVGEPGRPMIERLLSHPDHQLG
jgi:acetylornithine/succinyldiaminopimelate/putrescine aminotransferase